MARADGAPGPDGPLQARDVVAFGQEVGRVLSDGRIVGRAEPFAKVFPSSRAVKRAVGVTAWAILEDIALDARLDVEGRLVAETNVRRIGDNLGLSKNTVTRHLGRLRQHGFVLHEEQRDRGSGRYEVSRYVLDPSACLERFTVTPTRDEASEGRASANREPRPTIGDTAPRPTDGDTARRAAVSQPTRHREVGQKNKRVVREDQHQQPADDDYRRLVDLAVAPEVARALVERHPAEQIRDALDAVEVQDVRSPAGWVLAAVRDSWDLSEAAADVRAARAARQQRAAAAERAVSEARHQDLQRQRADGWAALVAEVLDDEQLRVAVARLVPRVPGLDRRSVPMARARLAAWAAAVHVARPDLSPGAALTTALATPRELDIEESPVEFPEPPAATPEVPLDKRLVACLEHLEPDRRPDRDMGVMR